MFQVFDIHNGGDTSVGYRVDTRPLDDLQASNYLMPILKCLQPQGEIPSGGTASLEFVFSPLEAKKYTVSGWHMVVVYEVCQECLYFQVDLPIHLTSGKTVIVNFSGEGYDPKQLKSKDLHVLCYENPPVGYQVSHV